MRTPKERAAEKRSVPRIDLMEVRYLDGGWSLVVDELATPAWTVTTKAKAVKAARDAAKFHKAKLKIFTKSGNCNKVYEPAAA